MSVDWRTSYHDLCREIDILQERESDLEEQAVLAQRVVFSGEIPSDRHYCRIPLDKALSTFDDAMAALNEVREAITRKTLRKMNMEQHMGRFEGLEYKVAYLRDIEGKHLDVIADELGYSYKYIQNISSRVKRTTIARSEKRVRNSANVS